MEPRFPQAIRQANVRGMLCGMRMKTSVTLPDDLLRSLDRLAGDRSNRSRLIEEAVRDLIERRTKAARDARDIDIINRNAKHLNAEAEDVLDYQVRL